METYTLKDVEKILHVDERTIFRYLADGRLKGSKPGGKWLFTKADINRFWQAGKKKRRDRK